MKTYVFGDSYSVEFDNLYLYPPGHEYCNWKGYVPKKYFHLLSEKFGSTEIINYAMSGNDNDNIFEKFTEVYENIEQDDLVIFGWTMLNRFSICNNLRKDQPDEYLWGSSTGFNHFDWVVQAAINRNTKLYYNRIHKLINFINNILANNKVVHWTWKYEPGKEMSDEKTIKYETNGDVNDYHYNEKTHIILYEKMIKEFENNNKISIDLWLLQSVPNFNISI